MRDFPPTTTAFLPVPDAQAPDTSSPGAFLRWHLGQQRSVIVASALVGILWQLPLTVGPWLVGRTVDRGILPGDWDAIWLWSGLLLLVTLVGAVFGIAMHTLIVRSWLIALYGTTQMVARKAVQLGHVLPRRAPTGEVLSVASSDSDEFGALTEITARASAQLVAYLIVAAIVLSTSLPLGILVLVAAPVLVGVAFPMLRPLHRRQAVERTRSAELTSMATDIVAGLRILRGIGGERTFGRNYAGQSQRTREAGVSAGIWQAAIEAIGVLMSGCFLVVLMWAGTREVLTGDLSVGQLIAFLGYGLFMVGPIRTFFEFAQKVTRALVSARKAIALFEQAPPWHEPAEPRALSVEGDLVDEASGFVARPGRLTIVVSAVPESSAALADRLGRYLPADTEPVAIDDDGGLKGRALRRSRAERQVERERIAALDEARARSAWGVRLDGVDLASAALDDVRRAHRGQRHRQPALRRLPPGRHRPPRRADPRAGRGDDPGGQRRGRLRRAARRLAGRARRAWPRAVRGPAPARGARPRPRRPTPRSSCWSSRPPPSTRTPRPASPSAWRSTGMAARPSSRRCRRCGSTTPTRSPCSRTTASCPSAPTRSLLASDPAYRRVVIRAMDEPVDPTDRDAEIEEWEPSNV